MRIRIRADRDPASEIEQKNPLLSQLFVIFAYFKNYVNIKIPCVVKFLLFWLKTKISPKTFVGLCIFYLDPDPQHCILPNISYLGLHQLLSFDLGKFLLYGLLMSPENKQQIWATSRVEPRLSRSVVNPTRIPKTAN